MEVYGGLHPGDRFTCFTGTKVLSILALLVQKEAVWKCMAECIQELGLLALLVQKDKIVHSHYL